MNLCPFGTEYEVKFGHFKLLGCSCCIKITGLRFSKQELLLGNLRIICMDNNKWGYYHCKLKQFERNIIVNNLRLQEKE